MVRREPGCLEVLDILGRPVRGRIHERGESEELPGTEVYIPFMALMEMEYNVIRDEGLYEVDRIFREITAWPLRVVESTFPMWRVWAARVKSKAGLSLGDSWNAALALLLEAELVHKDPEFDKIEGLRSFRLPYK
jgi:predicted nucleic acid-binding protein